MNEHFIAIKFKYSKEALSKLRNQNGSVNRLDEVEL